MFWFDKKIVDYIIWWRFLDFTKEDKKEKWRSYSVWSFMKSGISEIKRDLSSKQKKHENDKNNDL